jgi:putative alpha-1,2-mannosidase
LNGNNFDQTFISHQSIVNGGELNFQMDAAPNYKWGTSAKSRPVSPLAALLEAGGK